jgi:FkbM family methyltransferase
MLENKKNHIVIEPDKLIMSSLKKNKKNFKAQFKICEKAISNYPLYFTKNGTGSYVSKNKTQNSDLIQTISLEKIMDKYKLNFNVLVVDCEGCICNLFEENPQLYKTLKVIIFEKDKIEVCNYSKIIKKLELNKFIKVDNLLNDFQQVWVKK